MPRRRPRIPGPLVGLRVRVILSPNPALEGLEGLVLSESSRALLLESKGRRVLVLKEKTLLEVSLPGHGIVRLWGDELLGRPSERIKSARWALPCPRRKR